MHSNTTPRVDSQRATPLRDMHVPLNGDALINRLPVELLVEIIAHLQSEDEDPDWFNALLVCKHWFVAGSTAAKLWRNLKVVNRTNLLRTGIARSRSADLSISVESDDLTDPILREVAQLVTPVLHRLRCLGLSTIRPGSLSAFKGFRENDMPVLHSLLISANLPDDVDMALTLSPTRFPRLRELLLSGVQVLRNFAIGSQLHEVEIRDCYGKAPELRTTALLEAVRTMQDARVIDLKMVFVSDVDTAPAALAADKVLLGQLEHLVIESEGPLIKAVLSVIVIPPTAIVSLVCPMFSDTWPRSAPNLRSVVPEDKSCLPVLAEVVSVLVIITPQEHTLQGFTTFIPDPAEPESATPDVDFRIYMPLVAVEGIQALNDIPAFDFDDLYYVFGNAPLEALTIHTMRRVVAETNWRDVFATFPALRTLTLEASERGRTQWRGVEVVFSALDPETEADADTAHSPFLPEGRASPAPGTVLCPNLRRIHIKGLRAPDTVDWPFPGMGKCLENRQKALGERLEELVLELEHDVRDHFSWMQGSFQQWLAPHVDVAWYDRTSYDEDEDEDGDEDEDRNEDDDGGEDAGSDSDTAPENY